MFLRIDEKINFSKFYFVYIVIIKSDLLISRPNTIIYQIT